MTKVYNNINTSICLPYSTFVVIHNDHDSFTTLHSFATLLSLDFRQKYTQYKILT